MAFESNHGEVLKGNSARAVFRSIFRVILRTIFRSGSGKGWFKQTWAVMKQQEERNNCRLFTLPMYTSYMYGFEFIGSQMLERELFKCKIGMTIILSTLSILVFKK